MKVEVIGGLSTFHLESGELAVDLLKFALVVIEPSLLKKFKGRIPWRTWGWRSRRCMWPLFLLDAIYTKRRGRSSWMVSSMMKMPREWWLDTMRMSRWSSFWGWREIAVENGGCAWMALNTSPAPPLAVAAAVFVIVGGCVPSLLVHSFAILK